MPVPDCGHDDGWCGGALGNNCVRAYRHTGPDDTTDYETTAADRAEKRWQASDDFYERAGSWER